MRSVAEEAWEVHQILIELGWPYAIIGGTAVQIWGEPRFTYDLDLTVLTSLETYAEAIAQLLSRLQPRIVDALAFARRNRVLLVQTSSGYPVDISFGLPGYEEQVIARSVEVEVAPGKKVLFCSAEDLIIHKTIAGRGKDVLDIQQIIARRHQSLDLAYIREWIGIFATLLETDDVIIRFEQAWRTYGPDA